MNTFSLLQAWSSLPKEHAIAYFGEENLLFGAKITILNIGLLLRMKGLRHSTM